MGYRGYWECGGIRGTEGTLGVWGEQGTEGTLGMWGSRAQRVLWRHSYQMEGVLGI